MTAPMFTEPMRHSFSLQTAPEPWVVQNKWKHWGLFGHFQQVHLYFLAEQQATTILGESFNECREVFSSCFRLNALNGFWKLCDSSTLTES